MPLFDDLFAASEAVLDDVFAWTADSESASFWPAGVQANAILVTANIRSLGEGDDRDNTQPENWQGYAVELYLSDLVVAGQAWTVAGGDAIAFLLPDGATTKVYTVTAGPNGKAWEPLDTVDRKIMVFCKLTSTG
jgi:hypothetical protein